ncbi:MAG: (2Fe-2S)-binding protein [Opitutae bacterium]|nr:(2Fe-2S)-binding protein [Opitutae bacterium]
MIAKEEICEDQARRGFFAKVSVALGALLALFPLGAGIGILFDPVRRKSGRGDWIAIAPLSALPEDGSPVRFPVILKESIDAWTKKKDVPIGAVYLKRVNGGDVVAFNVTCPHLGCAIDFRSAERDYFCPCHNSSFGLDGSISNPDSPSPRPMDSLQTKVEKGEIKVKYLDFRAGIKDKIPIA